MSVEDWQRAHAEAVAATNAATERAIAAEATAAANAARVEQITNDARSRFENLTKKIAELESSLKTRPLTDLKSIKGPAVFTSKREEYKTWAFKMGNFLAAANELAEDALTWAESQMKVIEMRDVEVENVAYVPLAKQIYFILTQQLQGEAFSFHRNVRSRNGLETWRKLAHYYDPTSVGRKRVSMRDIIGPRKPEVGQFMKFLEEWEKMVADWESKHNKEVDEDIKIGVLTASADDELQRHLLLNSDKLNTYPSTRNEIELFYKSKRDMLESSGHDTGGAAPMDIGYLGYQQGSWGGKHDGGKGKWQGGWQGGWKGKKGKDGKGKGKDGKGKGKGGDGKTKPFQGYCDYCQIWGHKKSDCRKKKRDDEAKNAGNNMEVDNINKGDAGDGTSTASGSQSSGSGGAAGTGGTPKKKKDVGLITVKEEPEETLSAAEQLRRAQIRERSNTIAEQRRNRDAEELQERERILAAAQKLRAQRESCEGSGNDPKKNWVLMIEVEDQKEKYNQNKPEFEMVLEPEDFELVGDDVPVQMISQVKSVVIDSGSAVHTCPDSFAPSYPTEEAAGENLCTATGTNIRNAGKKTVQMTHRTTGDNVQTTFLQSDVKRAIMSAGKMTDDKDVRVILEHEAPMVLNKVTGAWMPLRKENGVFVMDVDVNEDPTWRQPKFVMPIGDEAEEMRLPEHGGEVPSLRPPIENEEARAPLVKKSPIKPSELEVQEHNATHIPYRSWCPVCVRSRGRNDPHKAVDHEATEFPSLWMDYWFASTKAAKNKEEKKASEYPCLAMFDFRDKGILSLLVPQKGLDEMGYASAAVIATLKSWDYEKVKIIMKSDQEKAITAVVSDVKSKRKAESTIVENSAVGESQSNGPAENAVQKCEGLSRSYKDFAEEKAKIELVMEDDFMAWVIRHAGWTHNRFAIGEDGKTPFERKRGKKFRADVIPIGEMCLWRVPEATKGPKLAARWKKGVWLGRMDKTNEILVGTPEGVFTSRCIRRLPKEEQWDGEAIKNMKGLPWELKPGTLRVGGPTMASGSTDYPVPHPEVPRGEPEPKEPIFKRTYLTKAMVERFGATRGCAGCREVGKVHTEACRTRMEGLLTGEDDEKQKLQKQIDELNEEIKKARAKNEESNMMDDEDEAVDENELPDLPEDSDNEDEMMDGGAGEQPAADVAMESASTTAATDLLAGAQKQEEEVAKFKSIYHICCEEPSDWIESYVDLEFYDDLTGALLPKELVVEARKKELFLAKQRTLYIKVPLSVCWEHSGGPPIGTKWVDINKRDEENPEIRSRLVAQQFNRYTTDEFFAPTPPLAALKIMLSILATYKSRNNRAYRMRLLDVIRAHWYARATSRLFIDLPAEDAEEGMCGELMQSMYGTREAGRNWHLETERVFVDELDFEQGKATPCIFYSEVWDARALVHGDDIHLLAEDAVLDLVTDKVLEHWDCTVKGTLGPDGTEVKELLTLNRCIRWVPEGYECEADPRHAEIIVAELGLLEGNAVTTPATKTKYEIGDDASLPDTEAKAYRGISARTNYLAEDRSELKQPSMQAARGMKNPTRGDLKALKRIGRYLKKNKRVVQVFVWQGQMANEENPKFISVYGDTDHAGCIKTRKSTNGGACMHGKHTVYCFSTLQSEIADSSGLAEYYGSIKSAKEGLGLKAVLGDLHIDVGVEVLTDSAASKGICSRQGLGKVKHIEVKYLWLQQEIKKKRVIIRKIPRYFNPGDLFTHCSDEATMLRLMKILGHEVREGRSNLAPQLASGVVRKRVSLILTVAMIFEGLTTVGSTASSKSMKRWELSEPWEIDWWKVLFTLITIIYISEKFVSWFQRLRRSFEPERRHVMCQAQVTYTELRGAAAPRFQPLGQGDHGAWVG